MTVTVLVVQAVIYHRLGCASTMNTIKMFDGTVIGVPRHATDARLHVIHGRVAAAGAVDVSRHAESRNGIASRGGLQKWSKVAMKQRPCMSEADR